MRVAPQDLPTSVTLRNYALAAYFTLSCAQGMVNLPLHKALFAGVVDTGVLMGLSYILLWSRSLLPRWPQTVTALAGTGAVLEALSLPVMVWQSAAGESAAAIPPGLLGLGLLFWMLLVVAHILRHALSVAWVWGSALATVYMYLSITIMYTLFFKSFS